jgi:hypothetical protein
MIAGVHLRELAVLVPTLAAGLVGAAVATESRDADSEFLHRQQHALRTAAVRGMDEGPPGAAARCRPHGPATRRNPRACDVRYRSGGHARLVLRLPNSD